MPLDGRTVCPSGLRGWTQVPLARAAWAQIPQLSSHADFKHADLNVFGATGWFSSSIGFWHIIFYENSRLFVQTYLASAGLRSSSLLS